MNPTLKKSAACVTSGESRSGLVLMYWEYCRNWSRCVVTGEKVVFN